jgi:ubiquinone/menaquinone biosynthesis C-methylase UbiE
MDYSLLKCPITNNNLYKVDKGQFANFKVGLAFPGFGEMDEGLVDTGNSYFYPVFKEIIILLPQYAIYVGDGNDIREDLSFDKKRVFDYYNEIHYKIKDALAVYEDSNKWVDYRDIAGEYLHNSFNKASRYYPSAGRYFLDIASGPIGLNEYIHLSDGYEVRICIDISVNALIQAKYNLEKKNKKGIFICGDIINIPLQDNSCDVVLSQHTLYHIPKNDQFKAINELYRVCKKGSKVVIVYSWFLNSRFMNISLNVVQLYRLIRHFGGKLYVKVFRSKPRLYFYTHSPRWFKKSFEFSKNLEIYCWRSVNKYFLNIFIHKWFLGRTILNLLSKIEDKYPKMMGILGEYPVVVITKK